jgi:collagenase-like PrtC family protease
MKYSIPYTKNIYNFIANLSENNKLQISDMYFSDNKFASNRGIKFNPEYWDEIKAIKETYDIPLHYVINPSVYDNNIYMGNELHNLINLLWSVYDSGCTILTFNNSFLMRNPEFRQNIPPIKIKPSVNNKIITLENVEFFYNEMGIKDFILDRSLNRNFDELERIYEWTKNKDISLTLLANEGCLPNCMWKQHCDNLISQYHKNEANEVAELQKLHSNILCAGHFKYNPSDVLKSPFIPPNAIKFYEGKIDVIKIAGRMASIDILSKVILIYMNNKNNNPLYEFLQTNTDLTYKNIYFSELEDYNFSQKTLNCKNKCSTCDFCDTVYKIIISGD